MSDHQLSFPRRLSRRLSRRHSRRRSRGRSDSSGDLIISCAGASGVYQVLIVLYLYLCRIPDIWRQLLVVIVAPPTGDFSCANESLSQCDPECPSHKFDHSIWNNTVIYQWDLVCEKEYIPAVLQSAVMLGLLVGNITFGIMADRFGRKGPLVFCVFLHFVAGVGAAFVPWLWLYILLRSLCNFAVGGTMLSSFAIATEFIGPKYRPIVGILFAIPCEIAYALLGLIGYFVRRWDYIQLIVSAPSLVLLTYCCILPESPRWLLTMNKPERVIKILSRMAKCNKLPTDKIRNSVELYLEGKPVERKGGKICDLFKTKRMRTKTLVLMANWLFIAMSYYGISIYVGHIGGNTFLNISIAGVIQIPGTLAAYLLISRIGRKYSILLFYFISFMSMFFICPLPLTPPWPIQTMALLSMMGIGATFSVTYLYSGELYPTIVRALGMGMSAMCAGIGSMVAPFIVGFVSKHGTWVSPLIFGAFPAFGAMLIWVLLPETKEHGMPDTIEQADKI